MPVSSEIWAFHSSTGSSERNSRRQRSSSIDDLLLGQRQRHAAARGLAGQPQLADLLEQGEHLVGAAGVELRPAREA